MRGPPQRKPAMKPPYDFIPAALVKEDLVLGGGTPAEAGDDVLVHYVGWLAEGLRQFDSSRARRDPLDFSLGAGDVIKGFDQGVAGMRVGGKRRLTIPPALGYAEQGCGGVIPPQATLIFEVELLRVS
jgi:FKBP-type peptidyl-prolyl cis-trans isomerase